MALKVDPSKMEKIVALFYGAQSTRDKVPAGGALDKLTMVTATHGRLMLATEEFPVDFIIQPYDLKPKEVCDQRNGEFIRELVDHLGASHLYSALADAMKKDGFVIEIVGDKVIANPLKQSFGETDEQEPARPVSKTYYVEHHPDDVAE